MIKKDTQSEQEINTQIYQKKKKIQRQNIEETDIMSEEKKQSEYGKGKYHNMLEEKKKKDLKGYQKNYREAKTSQYNNQ